MTNVIVAIVAVLIGLGAGASFGLFRRKVLSRKRYEAAQEDASRVLEIAGERKRAIIIEAKEEALSIRSSSESEIRERRSDLNGIERRLSNREEQLDRRGGNLDNRERHADQRDSAIESRESELEDLTAKETVLLESISRLSMEEAEARLLAIAEDDIQHEIALRYRDHENRAREEAEDKARNIVAQAVQRIASIVGKRR